MKALEDKILNEGVVKSGDVLKVDGFLNHQIDVAFLNEIGKEFYRLFKNNGITKVLTIEASGIGVAVMTAQYFDVKVVFAKKSKTINISDDVYHTHVYSYTHQINNEVMVSKHYLNQDDYVLIIDDFLANGEAVKGLIDIVQQSGAKVAGIGIVIEKGYQKGGQLLRKLGYHVESLAIIQQMNDVTGEITFKND
ncbi:MAG: xanthine phosphoribosyltransferase [Erysipelotrichaceae bacterium]|nr:xanthine phosphoribosyltransferase [Erysipelotrichaceae bacterium]